MSMKVFHSITVQLLVQQTDADITGSDADAARTLVERAVGAACELVALTSGRESRVRAIVVNPVRLLEPESKSEPASEEQPHDP